MENRTARLTILIDPRKKALFEEICSQQDLTPWSGGARLLSRLRISPREFSLRRVGGLEILPCRPYY